MVVSSNIEMQTFCLSLHLTLKINFIFTKKVLSNQGINIPLYRVQVVVSQNVSGVTFWVSYKHDTYLFVFCVPVTQGYNYRPRMFSVIPGNYDVFATYLFLPDILSSLTVSFTLPDLFFTFLSCNSPTIHSK